MFKARSFKASGGTMRHDTQLLTYVLLLRYGKIPDLVLPQPVMNYTSIAKIIRKPVSTVIELIKTAIGASIHGFSEENYSRSKFKQNQICYLVSP
jgi:hypothetical protein